LKEEWSYKKKEGSKEKLYRNNQISS